jgi:hypothetical protein
MITTLFLADCLKKMRLSNKSTIFIIMSLKILASLVLLRFFYRSFQSIPLFVLILIIAVVFNVADQFYLRKYLNQ